MSSLTKKTHRESTVDGLESLLESPLMRTFIVKGLQGLALASLNRLHRAECCIETIEHLFQLSFCGYEGRRDQDMVS